MLFQRLYNWIKYKTLPPSVLFKNRLFLERDSKHRRIFTNFGLTFRNSKWTNYETYNIKDQFKYSFLKIIIPIFIFFLIIFFMTHVNNFYINFYYYNYVAFYFWTISDCLDYYLSFVVWSITSFFSIISNLIYSYFFFINFSDTQNVKKIFSNKFFDNNYLKKYYNKKNLNKISSLSKHDYSLVLYSWLTNSKTNTNFSTLENFFKFNLNQKWWARNFDFFTKLYNITYIINFTTENKSSLSVNKNLSNLFFFKNYNFSSNLTFFFYENNLLNNNMSLIFSYLLKNNKSNYLFNDNKNYSTFYLNTRFEWNLLNFYSNEKKYNFLTNNKIGNFYFDSLNFGSFIQKNTFYTEFMNFNDNLKNQLDSAKWNRWLYRYSILHRKVLKNSHKLTLTKRLFNSSLHTSNAFDKNIWVSENLNKYSSFDNFLNSIFHVFYNENLLNKSTYNHRIPFESIKFDTITFLNFYENSFFWFLKRFYFFNTINSNKIQSSFFLKQNLNVIDHKKSYYDTLTYLLHSKSLNFKNINYINFITPQNIKFNKSSEYTNYYWNIKDLQLVLEDCDVYAKDNLKILYWFLNSVSMNSDNNFLFFNYFNYSFTDFASFNLTFDLSNNVSSINNDFNYYMHYNTYLSEKLYLNDLIIYNLLKL